MKTRAAFLALAAVLLIGLATAPPAHADPATAETVWLDIEASVPEGFQDSVSVRLVNDETKAIYTITAHYVGNYRNSIRIPKGDYTIDHFSTTAPQDEYGVSMDERAVHITEDTTIRPAVDSYGMSGEDWAEYDRLLQERLQAEQESGADVPAPGEDASAPAPNNEPPVPDKSEAVEQPAIPGDEETPGEEETPAEEEPKETKLETVLRVIATALLIIAILCIVSWIYNIAQHHKNDM